MSIFDSSTPALSGQKVPCEVGNSPVLVLGPVGVGTYIGELNREAAMSKEEYDQMYAYNSATVVSSPEVSPLNYLTPNQLGIISHALGLEGEERNVFYLSPTSLGIMTEVADLVESGYMEFTGVLDNGVECYAVTDYGKALVRPQRVQLAQARHVASDGQKVPCEVGKTPVLVLGPVPCELSPNVPSAEDTARALAALAPHLSHDRVAIASDGQSVRGEREVAPKTPLMAYCPECGELADFSDALMPEWAMYQCPECFMDFHVSELVPLDARRILPSELPNGGHIG